MVWRSLFPGHSRDPRAAAEEWLVLNCAPSRVEVRLTTVVGKQVVFVTNNSTKSRVDYRKKLEGLEIPSNVVSIMNCFGYP